jgi:hypothetical protein
LATKNPSACIACAKDPRAALGDGVSYLQSAGSGAQRACATCANLGDSGARQQ